MRLSLSEIKVILQYIEIRSNIIHQRNDEPEEVALAITAMLNQKEITRSIDLQLKDKVNHDK